MRERESKRERERERERERKKDRENKSNRVRTTDAFSHLRRRDKEADTDSYTDV